MIILLQSIFTIKVGFVEFSIKSVNDNFYYSLVFFRLYRGTTYYRLACSILLSVIDGNDCQINSSCFRLQSVISNRYV